MAWGDDMRPHPLAREDTDSREEQSVKIQSYHLRKRVRVSLGTPWAEKQMRLGGEGVGIESPTEPSFELCAPLKLNSFAQGRCLSIFACSIWKTMLAGDIEQLQSSGARQKNLIHFNSSRLRYNKPCCVSLLPKACIRLSWDGLCYG